MNFPTVVNQLELLDYGPEFDSEGGRLTLLPPVLGPSYRILVPKPDEDGLDIAGVRPMEIRVPLGTVRAVEHAAKKLIQEGLLLQEDADRFIIDAEASNVLR